MESRKIYHLRIFASVLFAVAILCTFAYVCIQGDLEHNILSYCCIGATVLLSLLFVQWTPKKILLTVSLAASALADIFLILLPSEKHFLIGVWILVAVQAIYMLFTLFLLNGNGLRAISIAVRAALCLLAYFLLPNYLVLTTIQMIFAMIVINAFVTLLILLFYFKTQWLTFLGFLLLFAYLFFSALNVGWGILLHIPAEFLTFVAFPYKQLPSLAFLCYVPANLLLALSSVWETHKTRKTRKANRLEILPAKNERPLTFNAEGTTIDAVKSQEISRPTQSEGIKTISLDDL